LLYQLIINGLFLSATYALLAMAFNLIWSTTKIFDMGFGALYAITAFVIYALTMQLGLPFWLAVAAAIPVSGLVGCICYYLVYLPLIRKGSSEFVLIASSLGILVLTQNIIQLAIGSEAKFIRGPLLFNYSWAAGNTVITGLQLLAILLSLACLSITVLFLPNFDT